MRTTIRMKDELLQKAKVEAAKNRMSLTAFIEDAVEQKLYSGEPRNKQLNDFKIITFGSGGVNSGVNLNDSSSLLDTMES